MPDKPPPPQNGELSQSEEEHALLAETDAQAVEADKGMAVEYANWEARHTPTDEQVEAFRAVLHALPKDGPFEERVLMSELEMHDVGEDIKYAALTPVTERAKGVYGDKLVTIESILYETSRYGAGMAAMAESLEAEFGVGRGARAERTDWTARVDTMKGEGTQATQAGRDAKPQTAEGAANRAQKALPPQSTRPSKASNRQTAPQDTGKSGPTPQSMPQTGEGGPGEGLADLLITPLLKIPRVLLSSDRRQMLREQRLERATTALGTALDGIEATGGTSTDDWKAAAKAMRDISAMGSDRGGSDRLSEGEQEAAARRREVAKAALERAGVALRDSPPANKEAAKRCAEALEKAIAAIREAIEKLLAMLMGHQRGAPAPA